MIRGIPQTSLKKAFNFTFRKPKTEKIATTFSTVRVDSPKEKSLKLKASRSVYRKEWRHQVEEAKPHLSEYARLSQASISEYDTVKQVGVFEYDRIKKLSSSDCGQSRQVESSKQSLSKQSNTSLHSQESNQQSIKHNLQRVCSFVFLIGVASFESSYSTKFIKPGGSVFQEFPSCWIGFAVDWEFISNAYFWVFFDRLQFVFAFSEYLSENSVQEIRGKLNVLSDIIFELLAELRKAPVRWNFAF